MMHPVNPATLANPDFDIAPAADFPHVAPLLAYWYRQEWGHLHPERSLADWHVILAAEMLRDQIPTVYVARAGEMPIGTAALIAYDMSSHPDLSPWLAGVYVDPEYRRRGLGSALVQQVVRTAAALGVSRLYLHTDSAQSLYARLGWIEIGREFYLGRDVVLMEIEPGSAVSW